MNKRIAKLVALKVVLPIAITTVAVVIANRIDNKIAPADEN